MKVKQVPWRSSTATLPSVIRSVARKYPNRIAIEDGGTTLTYAELDQMSDNIAKFLLDRDLVGTVGVHLPRSYQYIVAILGILKTGQPFVHVDAEYDASTIEGIVDDCQPTAVLTNEVLGGALPQTTAAVVDDLTYCMLYRSATTLPVIHDRDATAIIGYTSGTTNRPKGVAVSHRATLYAYAKFWEEIADCGPYHRFGYVTYLAWDALSPLVVGATGIVVPEEANEDIDLLLDCLSGCEINHCFLTPSLLNRVFDHAKASELLECLANLNVLWLGGEIIHPKLLKRASQIVPHIRLFNNYGPTECFVVSQGELHYSHGSESSVAAGRILPEVEYRVLDRRGNPVAEGQPGILFVSGPPLANGYVNMAKKTREKFLKIDGVTYYNTGDYCRTSRDRRLYVIAREDFQLVDDLDSPPLTWIEAQASLLAGIDRCVIISIPGQIDACVFFVKDRAAGIETDARLIGFLELHLNAYRLIEALSIPTHPVSQKTNYRALMLMAKEGVSHASNN